MSHSYVSCLVHCVFTTKGRRKMIARDLERRLWAYMGGIARKNALTALAVGGVDDHVHLLLSIPATMPLSKALQLIKGGSSKWIHDTVPAMKEFAWQDGYGAFTIGVSQVEETIAYIRNQREHHRSRTFEEEYVAFLKRHGIEYDERYVFG